MRNIISDDDSLQTGILPALREYNLAQFTTADVPGHQHQVSVPPPCRARRVLMPGRGGQCIVSEAARVGAGEEGEERGDRFWDPRSRTSFRFDHLALVSTVRSVSWTLLIGRSRPSIGSVRTRAYRTRAGG